MFDFFKKYKIQIISVCIIVVALFIAFLSGEKLNENNNYVTNKYSENKAVPVAEKSVLNSENVNVPETVIVVSSTPASSSVSDKTENKTQKTTVYSNENSTKPFISSTPTTENKKDSSLSVKKENTADNSNNVQPSSKPFSKDGYLTDPIPEGKPKPVEPQEQEIKDNNIYCTFSISCKTILDNISDLDPEKIELVPTNGWIIRPTKIKFNDGESAYDVLQGVCKKYKIHMESSWTPIFNSAYVEGINNLYEFDCGDNSGWILRVNDWFPNYGCSRYQLKNGDTVEWLYTCDSGKDVGK